MELTKEVYSGLRDQVLTTLQLSTRFMDQWGPDLNIIQLARHITRGCRGRVDESERVRQWIKENIEYRNDPSGHELIQDPIVTLSEQAGDCDDMTILAGCLLRAIGHDCEAIAVTWRGNDEPTHAVLMVYEAGVVVDAVSSVHVQDWPPEGYAVSNMKGSR
jgi:transglutaminase-like putative cysteine protease